MPDPIITLTTDFGARDGYVGAMKGVLLTKWPCTVVDLAHDVPRGDVAHAAWVVASSTRYFPPGTIHVVVVDPGVGSARRGLVVRDDTHYYVGPDNGVFGHLEVDEAWVIENPEVMARDVSTTFHGRDVFAPVAAHLARQLSPSRTLRPRVLDALGPRVTDLVPLPWGTRTRGEGRIVHVDHFGNLITDLAAEELIDTDEAIAIGGRHIAIVGTYSDVPVGQLLAYIGSAGTIEIAVRDGSAARELGMPRGTLVVPAEPVGPYR